MLILAVAIAGALGALSRWGISIVMTDWFGARFPYGTMAVNLLGCFLLGLLFEAGQRFTWLSSELRITLAVGFIGTFTTFSTFEFDTLSLARRGEVFGAVLNLTLNVGLGFILLWAGSRVMAKG